MVPCGLLVYSRAFLGHPYVYFAHSATCVPVVAQTAATCTYTLPFTAVLESGNVFGVQCHPEKSGPLGIAIVRNFVELQC